MDRSGLVVVESQLLSIATRQLRMIFGSGRTTRGNGCVLFVSKPVGDGGEDVEHLVDDVQRLCSTMVREMTGRSTLHITGENQETDFSTIKSKGKITFNKFMTDVGAVDGMPEELDTITEQQHFQCMLGMLYNDVVSDMPCGARMVTDFPRALCPTGVRLDVVLGKSVCVQLYSSTETIFPLEKEQMDVGSSEASAQAPGPQMKVYLNLNALANAIASYATAPIENELPLQWRQKSFTLSEASEVLHLVHTTLSAFWRQNPHNDRTKGDIMSLISIVSGDLREYIKGHIMLEGSDWRGVWRMELSQLEKCLELIEKWSFITQSMSKGGWEGLDCEISKDSSLIMFERRMRDAVRIRQLLASASRLISGNAVESIVPENIFGDSSLLNSKETPEESWRECLGRFEKEFSFLEDQLRGRVKQLFGNHQRGMEDAISLWKQHRTLLQRDGVKSGIESEMNAMSDFLLQQLDKAHKRYENSKKRCSNEANLLRAAKGAQAEYAHMPETASVIFGSSTHLDRVVNAAKELITQAQKDVGEALTSWISSVETQCQKLSTLQDAVVFDGSDKDNIRCVVHPAVKQLMQDVSGMQSWCGEIPKGGAKRFSDEADGIVAACKRFVKAAARSTQIVCNYNTVRQQMLPCTRPMLEAVTTRTLSHLLLAGSNKRLVSVSNYQELDGLNTRLQNAVEALSADNRRIRRFHCDFVNQVISLHDLDLSTHTDQWRTAVDGMRRSFEDFLQANSLKHHEEWQRHLDAQIYKALEHQYQRALESMHDKMQGFKVELVFKQGQVHFKPNFEAIREAYYVQMRDLVSIPLRFRGLQKKKDSGGPYEMYKHIPFMNNDRIVSVHTKAIALFAKLARVKKAFRSHVLVGTCGINGGPDVDTLVEASCKSLQNFVSGFNVVREQMRKLGAIEDNMKVDGFTISNIPVKASIEEQLHRLEESLLNTLRKSMQRTLADIDDFVFNASNIISRQPVTIDEVGEASRAYNGFLELMPTYENKFLEVEEMNCVLKQETSTVIDISSTKSRWEHLREAMASHHRIINASMSKMRVSVEDMIQKHLKDGQRFSTKWDKLKQQLIAALKEEKQTVIQSTLAQLKENYKELEELKVHSSELEKKCECFQLPRPNLSQIDSIVKEATRTADMWGLYDSLNEALDVMRKEDWLTFRSHIYVFEDFIKEWRTKLSSTEKPSKKRSGGDEGSAIVQYLIKLLDCWSLCVPMLRYVRGEGMMTEHWNEMFRLLDMERGLKSTDLTFGHILERHKEIVAAEVELKQLHARVQGEVQIRDALQDLRVWALEAVFTLITPADGTAPMRVKLISEWKEIMSQVSDNQALIGSLKDSPFFSHFADEVNGWELKLATLNEALVHMNANQRKWTYLEPIFSRGALPQEQARFKRVDKEFVSILLEVEADPRVMTIAQQGDIVDRLKTISEQMDRCQKSLIEFLETKRESFPRFYFISDEDMLEILGHSKSPSVIQTHLKKLFMGIHSVVLSEDQKFITHMVSADKETVELKRPVSIEEDDVEKWLVALDDCMKETLKDLLASCVKVQEVTDSACIEKYPSQILQVALQVHFSLAVESAITSKSLEEVEKGLRQSLNKLTLTPSDVGVVTMLKVKALILDIIHQIEIIELLRAKRVDTLESWWWRKQLRYYMTETQECVISMVDTRFDYTYEYQGNAAKLVHTPLTDKCFLVLTKGMQLGYGGNPYGPAGTGKTESVKALGSAMGRQVLVFNCDEGIDFKSMGRIFMGIIKCGAWGCFDEFNRLKIDQLSAISQMIQVIQEAIKNREDSCTLLNRVVRVNRNSGIFVTLNPAGKGYGGRSKLPDNLRQLFREVAMTQPDNELITSTMLLSEGFTHARKLAKKAVELYRLSGQLMTKQQHYDWGLRSLKAVLRLAGSLVQKWKVANEGKTATEVEEGELILQSLSINMLSKLTFNDARLFKRLAEDVLPGVKFCDIRYDELEPAIETATKELGLQLIPSQVRKVLQLYEALGQRMGVVLVGPSGSGKSTLLRILRKALQVLKVEVPLHVMNPKAMSRQQLLGYMDPDTREWYDGVLSAAARDVVKQPKEHRPWILCDGDIDPEWIESLNSVLDDNKLLTLPNGVRIQFGNNVNFVFETHSLSFASPATVSRMGVILLSEEDVDLEPAVQSFLQKQSAECRELIGPLVEKYLIPAVRETLKLDALIVPTTPIGILNCCLTHVIHSVCEEDFVLSLMRGLCGMLNSNGSQSITTKLYEMAKMSPVSKKRPLDTYYDRAKKRLAEFKADMQTENASSSLLNGEAVVQTVDVQRLMATLEPLVSDSHYRPLFLVGPEGSGKSVTLQQCFANHSGTRISVLHCSAQTSSLHLIQKLEQLCTISSTSNGRVFRPKEGDRLVIILKNVNLPKPDKYGTVELHAFMMQLIMYNGFYNSDLEWIGVEKVQLVASMNPVISVGRYAVTPRLLAIVGIVFMSYPSRAGMIHIYSAYFASLLNSSGIGGSSNFSSGTDLAQFVINVFERICHRFEGEEYAHCLFCPRSVTNWVTNVLMYDIDGQTTTLPAVLAYEAECIFVNCLARPEDHRKARKIITEMLATIGYSSTSSSSKDNEESLLFSSWTSEADERGMKRLKRVSYEAAAAEVEQAIVKYGREYKTLNVPVIPEVVSWLARVDRVLSRPSGHLVLVGRPGVGRRNAVCLAAFLLQMQVVTLNMMPRYGVKNFRQDLRQFVQRATTQNERLVLMLEDHHVVDEVFLEIINSLVSSGEVPGLFTSEEMETMYSSIREDAANDGYMGTIYSYFLQRLRRNLRVALIMDNCHSSFLVRLQSNPGLLSSCDLLWMGVWSNDAARKICKKRLADIIKNLESDPANKGFQLNRELFSVHESFANDATPERFQVLMSNYEAILKSKSQNSETDLKRLDAGLSKLHEAEQSVEKIQKDVTKKKEQVQKMQCEADKALTEIQKRMEESKEQRDQATELQERLKNEQEEIVVRRNKIEEELSGTKAALESAHKAVSSIRSEQLNEIRALKSPPDAVRDVLEGVLALLGVSDVTWQSMRKFLGERGVKERILGFDANEITPAIRENVSRTLQVKASSFKQDVIQRASVAAAPMASWVQAMVEYSRILAITAPLTAQLNELEENQKSGEEQLQSLKKKLKKIDKDVEELRREFQSKCKEAERLKDKLEKAEAELKKACDLLEKLSGEKTRWSQDAQKIESSNRLLPKRAVVAAAFITYIARETEDVRQRYLKQWSDRLNIPEVVSVTTFMKSESDLLQWKSEGLPGDDLSQENAIAMTDSVQSPLVIDPANQAIEWVKAHLKTKSVVAEVTSMHDERFAHTLELAVRFGKTLLVMDVDTIDPILFPILRRDLYLSGAKNVVQVGNKQVDWQDTFRIMLFTRRTDFELPPNASALVLIVNFSVTKFGLENQLLGVTIQHERPELEQERAALLQKEEGLKLELSKLEERLLNDLASSSGNLLENTALIQALNDVKVQASSITESLQKSHTLKNELNEKREVYRPFASKGATVFFLVKDLEKLNRMYHFGLSDFVSLFLESLKTYEGSAEMEVKIPGLSLSFAQKCFIHVSRGLLERDRLVFGLHLMHGFFPDDFPSKLWRLLVGAASGGGGGGGVSEEKGAPGDDKDGEGALALPSWAPPTSRQKFTAISSDESGAGRMKRWKLNDSQKWGEWILETTPEESIVKSSRLTMMDQLLFVDTFRPDRFTDLGIRVVTKMLQLDSLTPLTSLEDMIVCGKPSTPIILITSRGADPSMEVQEIAFRRMERQRFTQIALGGGQTEEAMLHLRRCAAQGDWLFLKNLHLVLDWASVLEKELSAMPPPNPDFRLIVTTELHDLFPTVLLRMSTKITIEAPPGVKQNLLRSYITWDEPFLQSKTNTMSQMLFGLAWFHALLQERRNYVPQGWVKFYEFSPADLKAAADVLCSLRHEKIDWITLRGLLQNCIYGGRLENQQDEQVLSKLISKIFNEEILVQCSKPLYEKTCLPQTNQHSAVVQFIRDKVADVDWPALLYLPDNADRAVKEQHTARVREDLRSFVQIVEVNASAKDVWRSLLVPVLEVYKSSGLQKMPLPSTGPNGNDDDPMWVFFVSELSLLNDIAEMVSQRFVQLEAVAAGSLIPSAALREEATDLIGGRVPSQWLDEMDGPKEYKPWINLLNRRLSTMAQYAQKAFFAGETPFDLVDFLRPETFLIALRQFTARTTGIPLVDMSLVAMPSDAVDGASAQSHSPYIILKGDSIQIQGALLGAQSSVVFVSPSSPSSTPLSTNVRVWWASGHESAKYARIPLYASAARSTKVLDIFVSGGKDMDTQLLLGGVAAFILLA